MLAESDLTGNINEEYVFFNGARLARVDRPSGAVHYYFSDHLGSSSVITDASGSVQELYYYYPFGGMQSSIGSDPNHYKFTGKERDAESGLDNFGARYDSSALGRFMTPDWAAKPTTVPYAKFGDPQTLNLYTYVENAPVNRADADGHRWGFCIYGLCLGEPAPPPPPPTPQPQAQNQSNSTTPPPPPTPDPAGTRTDPALNPSSSTTSSPADQTQAPMESRGQQGGRGRGQTGKPDKPPKGVKADPARPGEWLEWNKHKGAWVPKPPGWTPDTQKKIVEGAAAVGVGAAIGYGVHIIVTTAPEWLPFAAAF